MLREIRAGDRVKIRKPADVNEWPSWETSMDRYDGTIIVVERIESLGISYRYVFYDRWKFNLTWLEPVRRFTGPVHTETML